MRIHIVLGLGLFVGMFSAPSWCKIVKEPSFKELHRFNGVSSTDKKLLETDAFSWSPDSTKVIVRFENAERAIFDVVSGTELKRFKRTSSIEWSPDSTKVVACFENTERAIFDVVSGKELLRFERLISVEWSPDSTKVVARFETNTDDVVSITEAKRFEESHFERAIFDVISGKELMRFKGQNTIQWSPDSKMVGVYFWPENLVSNEIVRLFENEPFMVDIMNLSSGSLLQSFENVIRMEWSDDSKYVGIHYIDLEKINKLKSTTGPGAYCSHFYADNFLRIHNIFTGAGKTISIKTDDWFLSQTSIHNNATCIIPLDTDNYIVISDQDKSEDKRCYISYECFWQSPDGKKFFKSNFVDQIKGKSETGIEIILRNYDGGCTLVDNDTLYEQTFSTVPNSALYWSPDSTMFIIENEDSNFAILYGPKK